MRCDYLAWLTDWIRHVPKPWEDSPNDLSIKQIAHRWQSIRDARNGFISELDQAGADRVVIVTAGGPQIRVMVNESLIQLACHGTHHRAQAINMLRQVGVTMPPSDYIAWRNLFPINK